MPSFFYERKKKMDIEERQTTLVCRVYWVLDADNRRRLFHDQLAAHLMEERWAKERIEREKATQL
jgi:hypothetical protein